MSGRIRTIKPELLEDAKTAELSDREWRLFVSLLLMADDHGNMHGDPKRVDGSVFWASRDSLQTTESALETLARVSLITRYTVAGQRYIAVNGWAKHQRVDKPSKPRVPGPSESDKPSTREVLAKVSGESRESLAPDLRPPTSDQGPPTSDQGGGERASAPLAPASEPKAAWESQEPPSGPQAPRAAAWTAETQAIRFRAAFEASQATPPGMGGQHVGRFHADVVRTAELQGRDPAELFAKVLASWLANGLSQTERRAPYACFQSAWGDLTAKGAKASDAPKGDTAKSLREQASRALAAGNSAEVKRLMDRVKEIELEESRRGKR